MQNNKTVTCLGKIFSGDEARRKYFTAILKEKLPKLKQMEGFPHGTDEDILALSDPPYYMACPNPFINDFIIEWEKEKRERRKGKGKSWKVGKREGELATNDQRMKTTLAIHLLLMSVKGRTTLFIMRIPIIQRCRIKQLCAIYCITPIPGISSLTAFVVPA